MKAVTEVNMVMACTSDMRQVAGSILQYSDINA